MKCDSKFLNRVYSKTTKKAQFLPQVVHKVHWNITNLLFSVLSAEQVNPAREWFTCLARQESDVILVSPGAGRLQWRPCTHHAVKQKQREKKKKPTEIPSNTSYLTFQSSLFELESS